MSAEHDRAAGLLIHTQHGLCAGTPSSDYPAGGHCTSCTSRSRGGSTNQRATRSLGREEVIVGRGCGEKEDGLNVPSPIFTLASKPRSLRLA